MDKRVSSRGIIIDNNSIYLMFRRRINADGLVKEYYVIPGGGIELGETLEENVKRELKEEFLVNVNILGYLGKDEGESTIANFFACEIVEGIPKLGGPEKEKCCESNYYEIRKIEISNLDNIDILGKNMIIKAYNKVYSQNYK